MKLRIFATCFSAFWACSDPYPGFTPVDHGCFYRFDKLGDFEEHIDSSSIVVLKYARCADADCEKMGSLTTHITRGSLSEFCQGLNEFTCGDEITLMFDGRHEMPNLPGFMPDKDGSVYFKLIIAAELDGREFRGEEEFNQELRSLREELLLHNYVKRAAVNYQEEDGLYRHIHEIGDGLIIEDGRRVNLSYKAYFLDGTEFDNTETYPDSFEIVFGKPEQMIPGLSAGISGLHAGAEAKIILPSHLAFGAQGSSTGIVPPYEPVIYEVKIRSVQ